MVIDGEMQEKVVPWLSKVIDRFELNDDGIDRLFSLVERCHI